MIVRIPAVTRNIVDGKIEKKRYEKELDLDTSLAAQVRFETKFPELAKREDLYQYSERICAIETVSAATIISKLKLLYCWFDTNMDFLAFLKMFDLSDIEYVKSLTESIKNIFEIVFSGSAEKN